MSSWVLNLDRSRRALRASFFFILPILSLAATLVSPVHQNNTLLFANLGLLALLGVASLLSTSQRLQKTISLVALGSNAICLYFVSVKGIYSLLYLPLITPTLVILFDKRFGLRLALFNVLIYAGVYTLASQPQHDPLALRTLIASGLLAPLIHTLLYSDLKIAQRRHKALVDLCLHSSFAMAAMLLLTGFSNSKLLTLVLALALYASLKNWRISSNSWYPLLGSILVIPIYAYAQEESGLAPAMFFPVVSMVVYLSIHKLEALITSIALLSVTVFFQLAPSNEIDPALVTRFLLNSFAMLMIFHTLFVVEQESDIRHKALKWWAKGLIYIIVGVGVGLVLRSVHHDVGPHAFSSDADISKSLIDLWVWLLFTVVGSQLWIHLVISREIRAQLETSRTENLKLLGSLEAAVETAGLGMLERTESGVYIANTNVRKIFGFGPDAKITYNSLMALIHPEDIDRVNEFVESDARLESRSVVHRIIVNNETKWIRAFSSHRINENNQRTTNIGILDISAEKARESELEQQRDLAKQALSQEKTIHYVLDSASTAAKFAILELDCETRLVRKLSGNVVNPQLLMGDKTLDEAFGAFFGEEYLDEINHLIDSAEGTLIVPGKSAQTGEFVHWAKLSVSPPYSRNGRRYQAFSRIDVTELEQARRDAEEAKKELEKRREKQAELFSIIGHELRTPLASMKMMQDEMQLDAIAPYGANICDSTQLVLELLDDLRIVTQPDHLKTKTEQLDSPLRVITSTVNSLSSWLKPHNFVVNLNANKAAETPTLFATAALRQITSNLVKNAAIHSQGTTMWVEVAAELGETEILLTVKYEDDGRGLSTDEQSRVFEAFARGDTSAEGTGLGLYITTELAALMDGDINYFSSAHGGAGFELRCRLSRNTVKDKQETALQTERSNDRVLEGRRVLFAEDQLTLQLLTKSLLEKAGADIRVTDNGKQALEAFDKEPFELVITDAMMPEMDGYQLSTALRDRGYTGPIIAVTAAVIGEEIENLKRAGVDLVLPKPINMQRLKEALNDYWPNTR